MPESQRRRKPMNPVTYTRQARNYKMKQDRIQVVNKEDRSQDTNSDKEKNPYCVPNEIWNTFLHHIATHVFYSTIVNNLGIIVVSNQEYTKSPKRT